MMGLISHRFWPERLGSDQLFGKWMAKLWGKSNVWRSRASISGRATDDTIEDDLSRRRDGPLKS